MNNHMKRGAALLISILVLGALFLSFAVVGVQGSIRESGSLTALANKKRADALTRACLETALFNAASFADYDGGEILDINGSPCTIRALRQVGSDWIIETEAEVGNQTSRLQTTLSNRSPATIRSLKPVVEF